MPSLMVFYFVVGLVLAAAFSSARLSSALYSAALAGVDIRFFIFAPVAFV